MVFDFPTLCHTVYPHPWLRVFHILVCIHTHTWLPNWEANNAYQSICMFALPSSHVLWATWNSCRNSYLVCMEFSLFGSLMMPKPTGHTKGTAKGKHSTVLLDSIPSHTLHLESSHQPFVHTPLPSGSHSQPLASLLLFWKFALLMESSNRFKKRINADKQVWHDDPTLVLPQLLAGVFFKLIIAESIKMLKMWKYQWR